MKFPTLYKKTSTGAIQFWEIEADLSNRGFVPVGEITTTFGQLGTDKPQKTFEAIYEGKNLGKKNATDAVGQAIAEAKSRWEKQKKKGYVESVKAAEMGEVDKLIEGGIVPMLAHKYSEQGHKIKYPAYAQPKLDGIRCVSTLDKSHPLLWSRTRKPITSMPHIQEEIEKVFGSSHTIPDGELYNHEFKNDFEKIVSAVRKEEPEEGYQNVQYHLYDLANEGTFAERIERLYNAVHSYEKQYGHLEYIRLVPTVLVNNEEELMDAFEHFRKLGYEGAMVRNANGMYLNKRSYDLQKVKEFDDAEFTITGIEEGRGKLAGHVGSFVCRTAGGKEFLAKMRGETSKLREYFLDKSLWYGKLLTVQYQGLTGKEGVPRFPVGIRIREPE